MSQQLFDAVGGHTDDIYYGEPTPSGKKTVVKATTGWEIFWYAAMSLAHRPDRVLTEQRCSCPSKAVEFLSSVAVLQYFTPTAVSFIPPPLASLANSVIYDSLEAVFSAESKPASVAFTESSSSAVIERLFLTFWNGIEKLSRFDDAYDKSLWSLRLEDATDGLAAPCVIDVKLGVLSYSPFTDEKKKLRMQSRASALLQRTGIRVCGSHRFLRCAIPNASDPLKTECLPSRYKEKIRKPLFYALKTEEELLCCLQHFFVPYGELGRHEGGVTLLNHVERDAKDPLPLQRVASARQKTQKLYDFFTKTKEGSFLIGTMAFVSSSFLVFYDSSPDASCDTKILLIDFARCGARRLNYSEEENGFLRGLNNFARFLLCLEDNFDAPDCRT